MEIQLCIITVVCVLVSASLVDGETYYIPAVTLATSGSSSCPIDGHLEGLKSELFNKLSNVLQNNSILACGASEWKRVAFLNMTDQDQACPDPWRLYEQSSVRACGRQESSVASCDSVLFSSDLYAYSHVCGRVTGYQYASPCAGIHRRSCNAANEINGPYLDGISITHRMPRQHIWSFYDEVLSQGCCSPRHINNTEYLGFIRNNYFCDTGNPTNTVWQNGSFFSDHPLWDGTSQCSDSATCCAPDTGPWFHASLPHPTMTDIEVRICGDKGTAFKDTPVELLEIYIK